MPFLDRDEIARSLTGAWRVFLDKPDAAQFFDLSVEGFWRSFRAFGLMIPFYGLVAAAEYRALIAANADVGVTVAEYFPSLRLTGVFGGLAPQVSDLFKGGKQWSIGGGLLTPLFQGRRLKNQNRAAVARFEQAKVEYERSVTNAFSEVSTALVAYERLAHVEEEQARAVAAYREAVDLANERYLSGLADYLEVLLAQRQLFPAENTLTQVRFERLAALVDLYRALGGGWRLEDTGWTVAGL